MKVEIPQSYQALNRFLSEERSKVFAYLHKAFNLEDADMDDIYQEASVALYLNIKDGKLTELTSSLSTYFLRVCINQALKFLSKKNHTIPLLEPIPITTKPEFLSDKIDEIYNLSTEDMTQEELSFSERIVVAVFEKITDTCRKIFRGYYWNNYDNDTIAIMYGFANANSVKAQKYKCVNKFKQKYKELIRRHYE